MPMVTGVSVVVRNMAESDLGLYETCRLDLYACTMCWDRMRDVRRMASARSPVWTAVSCLHIYLSRILEMSMFSLAQLLFK